MTFPTDEQKLPPKKTVVRGCSVYNLHAITVSLCRYDFVVNLIKNGRQEFKNSLTGNNWGLVTPAAVIKFWVA